MALPARHSTTRLNAAHPRSPTVPRMNTQTMILSLLLSRWKHMVTTFSSSASLQKSMPWLRQKAFVHSEQDVEADRRPWADADSGRWPTGRRGWTGGPRGRDRRRREEEDEPPFWPAGPRGMIVLFLKQVHLQKTGAAGRGTMVSHSVRERVGDEGSQFADASAIRAASSSARRCIRAILKL